MFSRYPRPGRVKTRLLERLGAEGAASLHQSLAEQTLARALAAACLRPAGFTLRYTGGTRKEMIAWLGPDITLQPQHGMDLGERMASAFQAVWKKGVQRAVLIGSDCPGLSAELIGRSLAELVRHDLVLGPAVDGGYYLIGLRRDLAPAILVSLFTRLPWGTDSVCRLTLARAAAAGLAISTMQELHDIDRPADLTHLGNHPHPQ